MTEALVKALADALAALAPAHECDLRVLDRAVGREDKLLDALIGDALPSGYLRIWRQAPCITVPHRFGSHPQFRRAAALSADEGRPLALRSSGGTAVALHAGVLNVSLFGLERKGAAPLDRSYRALIGLMSAALATLSIAVDAGPVDGACCDGRFNLRWRGRKLAGTAAAVRSRRGGVGWLAHASLVVDADMDADIEAVARVESLLGIVGAYRGEAHATVAQALEAQGNAGTDPAMRRESVPA